MSDFSCTGNAGTCPACLPDNRKPVEWSEVRERPADPARWAQIKVEVKPVMYRLVPAAPGKAAPANATVVNNPDSADGPILLGWDLSICGVEGAHERQGSESYRCADGKTRRAGSFGQCHDALRRFFPDYAEHLPHHLNGMRAGCSHQETGGWRTCQGYHASGKECPAPALALPEVYILRCFAREGGNARDCRPWKSERPTGTCRGCRTEAIEARGPYPWGAVVTDILDGAVLREAAPRRISSSDRCQYDALGAPCPTCGYRYGSMWLYREIPVATLAWARGGPHK